MITKNPKTLFGILGGGALIGITLAIALPLTLKASNKKNKETFDWIEIQKQMKIATKLETSLDATQIAIIRMYQNNTKETLSLKAKASAHVLAKYINNHKTSKILDLKLGKDKKNEHLLLLTIKAKGATSSQKSAISSHIYRQNTKSLTTPNATNLVNLPQWVTGALKEAEFGILFSIYQKRIASQTTIDGTKVANATIQTHDFPNPYEIIANHKEILEDQIWKVKPKQILAHAPMLNALNKTPTITDINAILQQTLPINDQVTRKFKIIQIKAPTSISMEVWITSIENIHIKTRAIFTIVGFVTQTNIASTQVHQNAVIAAIKVSQPVKGNVQNYNFPNKVSVNSWTIKLTKGTMNNKKGTINFQWEIEPNNKMTQAITPQDAQLIGFDIYLQYVQFDQNSWTIANEPMSNETFFNNFVHQNIKISQVIPSILVKWKGGGTPIYNVNNQLIWIATWESGNYYQQIFYQLAHEWMHHVIYTYENKTKYHTDKISKAHEVLCTAFSYYALFLVKYDTYLEQEISNLLKGNAPYSKYKEDIINTFNKLKLSNGHIDDFVKQTIEAWNLERQL